MIVKFIIIELKVEPETCRTTIKVCDTNVINQILNSSKISPLFAKGNPSPMSVL